jgi:polyferredoxin
VRRPAFRYAHLAAIVVVAGEALAGIMCPLTVWEDALRGGPVANAGFVARWLHRVLYWSFPDWVFTTAYVAFALAVAVTLWLVPPRR